MPPKKPPMTAAEKEEQRLKRNALAKEKYASKSREEKEEICRKNKERRENLKRQRTAEENEEHNAEVNSRRKVAREQSSQQDKERRKEADAARHRIQRAQRTEEQITATLIQDRSYRESELAQETAEERTTRLLQLRLNQRVRMANQTEEQAATARDHLAETVASWRLTENQEETEARQREDRERHAALRLQREETDELQRAAEAQVHAEIVPDLHHEELEVLVDRRLLKITHLLARKAIVDETTVPQHDCGQLNVICEECDAKHFKKERPADKKFTDCCYKGRVILPPPKPCPEPLKALLTDCHPQSKHFRKFMRAYNSALAMASTNAKVEAPPNVGPYCYRVHGAVCHRTSHVGNLENPRFAQLFVLDAAQASELRHLFAANCGCLLELTKDLDVMLRNFNPYAKVYKTMARVMEEEDRMAREEGREKLHVSMVIHTDKRTHDQRRYNSPTANEIAIIFKSTDGAPPENIQVRAYLLIHTEGSRFVDIESDKPMCDPMCYPLLFPNGDSGWHWKMLYSTTTRAERRQIEAERSAEAEQEEEVDEEGQLTRNCVTVQPHQDVSAATATFVDMEANEGEESNEQEVQSEPEEEDQDQQVEEDPIASRRRGKRKRISQLQFYSSMIAIRDYFNNVLAGGPLFQQYLTTAFLAIEGSRMTWVRKNQILFHVASYVGLTDYIQNRAEMLGLTIGTVNVLPSSFMGSPRAMKQAYQDAMAMCGKFGKPSFFLTFTCNPKWPEITNNIPSYMTASDRPDLVARVFNLKKKELEEDIQKRQVLGVAIARIHVIEFQKRGLPHCHMLIWADPEDVPKTPEEMDLTISAEIPDKETHPRLHKLVMSHMIHGPCGKEINKNSPCMDGDICTKSFPKDLAPETIINTNGYPIYRRRDTGSRHLLTRNNKSYQVDNSWVVPYNPYLLLKYDCHINLEFCASITSVKYIFKYVYKGHDCADIQITTGTSEAGASDQATINWDETSSFMDSRYLSAPEAAWRILKNEMAYKSHAVCRLAVHLPFEQMVRFQPGQEELAIAIARIRDTKLTAWFKLNATNPAANQYHYWEIPLHFSFDERSTTWKPRKRMVRVVSRMYSVSIRHVERYCLRLLLVDIKGATSFEDLKTFEGVVYATFKMAAVARNLLEDDMGWDRALREAAAFQMPVQLRQLFVDICIHCSPANALRLFDKYSIHLAEDYTRRGHSSEVAKNLALKWIQDKLQLFGYNMETQFNLPAPDFNLINRLVENGELLETEGVLIEDRRRMGDLMAAQLNEGQRVVLQEILASIDNENSAQTRLFFLDGPGGTGKTFLYNTITNILLGQGKKVITVASTGIASTLLIDGTTFHSRFKLFPPITETTTSKIEEQHFEAKMIREASLIINDEATMMSNHSLNAIDKLFRKVTKNHDLPFGGKVFLSGGDFRQCLPVVQHGNRVKVVEATIKNCVTWPLFKQLRLIENMRTEAGNQEHAEWLIKLGNGTLPTTPGLSSDAVEIPPHCLLSPRDGTLRKHVFGDIELLLEPEGQERISKGAILCPKNDDCLAINNQIVNDMPGGLRVYKSIDTVDSEDPEEIANFSIEFLNTLSVSGLPPHKLKLKVGVSIILLKNINTRMGLCNGTRLIVKDLRDNIIVATISSGKNKGNVVFLPRMAMSPSDSDLPFKLKRLQFPVLLAFAVTINKSQGQTFDRVGISLPQPVFCHGQLYVAFSRATSRDGIRVDCVAGEKQGMLLNSSANPEERRKVFTQNIVYKEAMA